MVFDFLRGIDIFYDTLKGLYSGPRNINHSEEELVSRLNKIEIPDYNVTISIGDKLVEINLYEPVIDVLYLLETKVVEDLNFEAVRMPLDKLFVDVCIDILFQVPDDREMYMIYKEIVSKKIMQKLSKQQVYLAKNFDKYLDITGLFNLMISVVDVCEKIKTTGSGFDEFVHALDRIVTFVESSEACTYIVNKMDITELEERLDMCTLRVISSSVCNICGIYKEVLPLMKVGIQRDDIIKIVNRMEI